MSGRIKNIQTIYQFYTVGFFTKSNTKRGLNINDSKFCCQNNNEKLTVVCILRCEYTNIPDL